MKRTLLSFFAGCMLLLSGIATLAQVPMLPQTVVMGPGYANEVYYQFTTFNTTEVPRDQWDLSFGVEPMSANILINDGVAGALWTYPWEGTSGWDYVDTADLYTWPVMYNDPDNWENGAFNRFSTGGDDYGWGVYNAATQKITGDSIYILQLDENSYKKLWIVEKNTIDNTWTIRYANLDGTDFQEVTVDCGPYSDKTLVGFDMQLNLPVNYQPVKSSWDILFTKYMAWHPTGAPVVVTGVLSNPDIVAKKFYPVDPDFNDWWEAPWDSSRSTIGWDWKWFEFSTFTYWIEDSMVFYVKEQLGNVYRLKFTGFEGTSTGVIDFGIAIVMGVGIDGNQDAGTSIRLWPNPASENLHIQVEHGNKASETVSISLMDITGRPLRSEQLPPGMRQATWDIRSIPSGTYILSVTSGGKREIRRFVKL